MTTHLDAPELDAAAASALIAATFPHWRDLSVRKLDSAGVDNSLFRLGDAYVARFPRRADSVASLAKEQAWLPQFAGRLPLAIPEIVGAAHDEKGWPWSVMAWIEGRTLGETAAVDWRSVATQVAGFLLALHRIDARDGPAPGAHNFGRGEPIARRDAVTREAIAALGDRIDGDAAHSAWARDAFAHAPVTPPRWVHGDLHARNLLLRPDGETLAVLDFGCLGVGDPACDLALAWRLLPRAVRGAFRDAMGCDDDAWRRGRAWALSISVRELAYYGESAPVLTAIAARTLAEVLAE
ncbi:MAG: phosphotransferase [Alphaproteobacteria bacterium]|nr:phosphotransferase [Alphaproteobacteria bacterium]